ncbi:MAG: hypothetical protein L6R35_002385 [Caloplaca aegaea]|nr:MAG: hypothetical protein L6R35_002385 [Caloplaca aegaea]
MDLDSDSNNQANVLNHGEEITIRGAAGPCTVVGSNFAPGTTAADIESALAPIGGPMESCLIVSHRPTVVAEMVFLEKSSAENVIATFNNKKVWVSTVLRLHVVDGADTRLQADGRLLRLELKVGRPSMPSTVLSHESPRIDLTRSDVRRNEPPRNEPIRNGPPRNAPSEPKAARVDLTYEENSYATQREQSDRSRRLAQPEFQDGSYGFEHKEDGMEVDKDNDRPRQYGHMRGGGRPREERRLYSDDLYPRSRGRGYR